MTRDEIIDMAREAGGFNVTSNGWTMLHGTNSTSFLEHFANLVAEKASAAEREACAKVVDAKIEEVRLYSNEIYLLQVAAAIRARSAA